MKFVILSSDYLGVYVKRGSRIINQQFITNIGELKDIKLSDVIGKSSRLFFCIVPDMEYISKISFFEKPHEKVKKEAIAAKTTASDVMLSGVSLLKVDKSFQYYVNSIKNTDSKVFQDVLNFLITSSMPRIKVASMSQFLGLAAVNDVELKKITKNIKNNILHVSILENTFENSYVVSLVVGKTFLFSRYIKKDKVSDKYINQILRTTIEYLNTNLPNFKASFHVVVYSTRSDIDKSCVGELEVMFTTKLLNINSVQDMYAYFLKDINKRFFSRNYYPSMFLTNQNLVKRYYVGLVLKLGIFLSFLLSVVLGVFLAKKIVYDIPRSIIKLDKIKQQESDSQKMLSKVDMNVDINEFDSKNTIVNFNKENTKYTESFNASVAILNELFNDIDYVKTEKYNINKQEKGYSISADIVLINPEGYNKSMQEKYNAIKLMLEDRIATIQNKKVTLKIPDFVSKKSIKPDFTELNLSITINVEGL